MQPNRCQKSCFSLSLYLSLILILSLALFFFFFLFFPKKQDYVAYATLHDSLTPSASFASLAEQKRTGVEKEISYHKGDGQLGLKIKAAESNLQLDQVDAKVEMREELKQVDGVMQEELYFRLPDGRDAFKQENGRLLLRHGDPKGLKDWVDYPIESCVAMQTVRSFKAKKAVYYYKDNHLLAEEVELNRYFLPTHLLPSHVDDQEPNMTGWAQSAEICFLEGAPSIKASQLKGYAKPAMHFEAEEAVYDGKTMILSGQAYVDHAVGTLSAGQAILSGCAEEKRACVGKVDLYDQVQFNLKKAGELSCAEAHIDFKAGLGRFFGSSSQPFVIYSEECRTLSGSEERLPLIVKSQQMTMEFKPINDLSLKQPYVYTMTANENVTVDYNHDFIAAADLATFNREESSTQQLYGTLSLSAEGEEGYCHLSNRNGDLIHARQIFIHTREKKVHFAHPKGALFKLQRTGLKERIDFSADTMTWNQNDGTLCLRGDVSIAEKKLGQLTTDDQVLFIQDFDQGKKQLSRMESNGHTRFVHRTPSQEKESHLLDCQGTVVIDQKQLKVTMDSYSEMPQIFYQDSQGHLLADHIEVDYEPFEGGARPTKVMLFGHVKMVNKCEGKSGKQYLLADRVEIFPKTHEAWLQAKEGTRVLVFDEINELQVSAQGLKIQRDQLSKKESIQGIGDVRFTLQGSEIEELSQRFEQMIQKVETEI